VTRINPALCEAPPTFCGLPNGRVYKLARRVVAASSESLVVGAFSRYVCTRVWFVAEGALIGRSVPVSLYEFVIIQLAVYEFE